MALEGHKNGIAVRRVFNMVRIGGDIVSTFLTFIPFASSQFFNPLTRREVWKLGEERKVQYHTKFSNYTIAIWQQALAGGSADLGPVIFRTENGAQNEFEWTVQLYSFDLESSNVFFFWLKEGDPSAQGDPKAPSMSSA
ncbi:hypothetical protein VTK56DRAFT_5109 [Thermocarpiscus australiensis]